MVELNIFKEVPGREKFHSCILASYSLDYYYFEQRVLRTLRSKGIRNVSVFTDASIAEDALKNMLGNVKKISSLYTLTSVIARGAFHPKLYMFFGDDAILMIIGSGNLTSGGMGKNHESFISFYADNEKSEQLPIILQAWNYLQSISSNLTGIALRQQKWITEYCSLISKNTASTDLGSLISLEKGLKVSFLHNRKVAIWDSLKKLIDKPKAISKITIVSPFFDKNGLFLDALVKYFVGAKIDIYVQDTGVLLPVDYNCPATVKFYKWDETDIALESGFKKYKRFQHSKLFHFQSGETEYLVLGSPNATAPAFLRTSEEINSETAVLLINNNVNWLATLGISGRKTLIDIKEISVPKVNEKESTNSYRFLYKINSIDRYLKEFRISTAGIIPAGISIILRNYLGDEIVSAPISEKNKEEWSVTVSANRLAEQVVFGALYTDDGFQVSNSQIINNVPAIETLHPSPENRRFNKLMDRMIDGKYSELDLFDFYDAIRSEKKMQKTKSMKKIDGGSESNNSVNKTHVSYQDALQNMQKDESELGLEHFEPVRIWDAYFAKLELELRSREEEDIDDEEEGDIRSGKGREEKPKNNHSFESRNVFDKARNRVLGLFENYIGGLYEATASALETKGDYEVTLTDYAFFLLATTHLIDIAGKEYSYKEKKEDVKREVLLPFAGSLDEYYSFSSIGIDILGKFVLFLQNSRREKKYSDEYEMKKMELFKKMALGKIFTIIAIINLRSRIKEEHYWDKWCTVILLNALRILNPDSIKVRDLLKKDFKLLNIERISLDEAVLIVENLCDKCVSLCNADSTIQVENRIAYTEQIGYCFIEEKLPIGKPAKFYRISNPGLNYLDGDFISEKIYFIERGIFLNSFKKIGEIYNK